MATGRRGYRDELAAVVGGTWRKEAGIRAVLRRTDTDRGVDEAIETVQRAAGRMLVRWHATCKRARRWAGRQELGMARMRVVMSEWHNVCRRDVQTRRRNRMERRLGMLTRTRWCTELGGLRPLHSGPLRTGPLRFGLLLAPTVTASARLTCVFCECFARHDVCFRSRVWLRVTGQGVPGSVKS